jgi:hypothetical protein
MFPLIEWPAFLGAGVALVVGIIAFIIAGGLLDGHDRDRNGSDHGIRPAS